MTIAPAIDLLKKARTEHRVLSCGYGPKVSPYGLKAAEKLGLDPQRVFKMLFTVTEKGELLVAMVPMIDSPDLKTLAYMVGAKKTDMADPQAAQRATGYLAGGIGSLRQKKRLRTFIGESTWQYSSIHVSTGRRGPEVELAVEVLAQLIQGSFAAIGRE